MKAVPATFSRTAVLYVPSEKLDQLAKPPMVVMSELPTTIWSLAVTMAPLPIADALTRPSAATSAPYPTHVKLTPDTFVARVAAPIEVLCAPDTSACIDPYPTAVLSVPDAFSGMDCEPTAVFCPPSKLFWRAFVPIAVKSEFWFARPAK